MILGNSMFRAGMAEALGTFLLTFIGGAAICMNKFMAQPGIAPAVGEVGYGLLGIALAHGLALMCAVYMTAGISGAHINPAITIGMLVIGKIRTGQAFTYIGMQLAGAVAGGIGVWAMFASYRGLPPYLGLPSYDSDPGSQFAMSMAKAIGVEAMLTFVLMSVVLHTAVDAGRAARQMFGLCIGMAVTMGILIGGQYTGAAMNPARYFGPAVVSGQVSQMLVYFIGPIVGAVLAALFYKIFTETKEGQAAA